MADCETCKKKQEQVEPVTYLAYESMKSTLERTIQKLWILLIILVVLLVGSNIAWIIYEAQWEVIESTEVQQEVDASNGNAYVAGIGSVYYGESEADSQTDETQG